MKLRNEKIRGIYVPLVTPLKGKEKVDQESLKKLVGLLRTKVDGLIPCLSTGEGRNLSESLWIQMLESTLSVSRGLPVIAGIELKSTTSVMRRAKMAMSIGIDTVAVLPPFGEDIPQITILRHYERIAEIGVNILVYNKQMMCGTAIDIDTLIGICQIPIVVAVKEGSANPVFTQKLLDSVSDVSVMMAWEKHLTKTITHGSIVPLANLNPELCRMALDSPSESVQEAVDAEVIRYHLEAENPTWYACVKKELVKRGLLSSSRLAS
jgi:4-hydroxy-tetrahydrodipicolinate synthase